MPRPRFLSALPTYLSGLFHEISRHLLRRPVVGICAVARNARGEILLVRRGDTGTWALPGGTLEWGETLASALPRELEEETGARMVRLERVSGVYSRPDRDFRFHAVTTCVVCTVEGEASGPANPLEIREARYFAEADLPRPLAMGTDDMLADALADKPCVLE